MKSTSLFCLLFLLLSSGQAAERDLLALPDGPRALGMGGAYVALADDPLSGYLNPSTLRTINQVALDLFYTAVTRNGPDQIGLSFINPGSEHGGAFAGGIWSQGVVEGRDLTYYVPFSGTSFDITRSTHLGVVTRFPYVHSRIDSVESQWLAVGDLSVLQSFESVSAAAAIERLFGGRREFVARRVRWGGAFKLPNRKLALSYEWRGDETSRSFNFHWTSSHYGVEAAIGNYAQVRAGYVAAARHRYSVGMAVGNIGEGWRLDAGWEMPATGRGDTRWSVGIGFRQ